MSAGWIVDATLPRTDGRVWSAAGVPPPCLWLRWEFSGSWLRLFAVYLPVQESTLPNRPEAA